MNILVIDDNTDIRDTLKRYLELSDHTVTEACNGEEGFSILRVAHFDGNPFPLCICDLEMPKMSGIQVLEACRDEEIDTRILIHTGNEDKTELLMKLGAADVVYKGMDSIKTINKWIEQISV